MQHSGNEPVRTHAHVTGTDDEVVRVRVVQLRLFVGGNPLVLVMPLRHEQADASFDQLGQISDNEAGVLPGELDLARK